MTASNETYGINTIDILKGQYYYLPGLEPDDKLVALRTEPQLPYSMVRDRYTGLHMINFADSKDSVRGRSSYVKIHYILETKPPVLPYAIPEKPRHRYSSPQSATREDARCTDAARGVIWKLLQPASREKLTQPVWEGLQAIDQSVDDKQRVAAITRFCSDFQGNQNPAGDQNFLEFLLTQRQGTCRHRASAFVLLCHYYGLPARLVKSECHDFPEYSLDKGGSWQPAELGGAPAKLVVTSSDDFPPQQEGRLLGNKISTILHKIDETRLAYLVRAMGLKTEQSRNITSSGIRRVSEEGTTSLYSIVSNLLKQKESGSFALAVDLLEILDNERYGKAHELLGRHDNETEMQKLASAAVSYMIFSGEECSSEESSSEESSSEESSSEESSSEESSSEECSDKKSWIPAMKLMERLHVKARSMNMEPEWSRFVLVWLKELNVARVYKKIDNECYLAVFQNVLEKKMAAECR